MKRLKQNTPSQASNNTNGMNKKKSVCVCMTPNQLPVKGALKLNYCRYFSGRFATLLLSQFILAKFVRGSVRRGCHIAQYVRFRFRSQNFLPLPPQKNYTV